MMTEPTQSDFAKTCRTAAERLWKHRDALHRVSVRIGYWPEGMVIHANIRARTNAEMEASRPPQVIPWDEVATLTEARLIEIVDEHCLPLYAALGIKPA
jgi:hypothetical protein